MELAQYNKNLPDFLKITQEQLDEENQRQTELAGSAPAYNENQVRFNRAVNEEILAISDLQDAIDPTDEFKDYQNTRLAESYLERGMFEHAYRISPDERYKIFLKKIWKASETGSLCDCPKKQTAETQENGARKIIDVSFRLWRQVFDGTPQKKIFIYVCNTCRGVKVAYA